MVLFLVIRAQRWFFLIFDVGNISDIDGQFDSVEYDDFI